MSIINVQVGQVGLDGVHPRLIYIETTSTEAEVLATGYLNSVNKNYAPLQKTDIAVISTKATPTANPKMAIWPVNYVAGNWSLAPNMQPIFAAQYTTLGGAAAEAIAITGVEATDLAFVQVVSQGTAVVSVLKAVCTANTLTVTFSANPGNDAIINYQIIRVA